MRQTSLFLIAALLLFRGVAQASVDPAGPLQAAQAITQAASSSSEPIGSTSDVDPEPQPISRRPLPPRATSPRPASLIPMYSSFAALQVIDIDAAMKASRNQKLLMPVVGSLPVLLAVKAGTTAAIFFASERLRKDHHPVAAVVLMIGANSALAIVAAHNYSVAHGQ